MVVNLSDMDARWRHLKFYVLVLQDFDIETDCGDRLNIFLTIVLQSICETSERAFFAIRIHESKNATNFCALYSMKNRLT